MEHVQSKSTENRNIVWDDILIEILVRLPVKSLIRFKSVCKSWNSTICDQHFVSLHLYLSKSKSKLMQPHLLITTFPNWAQLNLYSYSKNEGIAKIYLSEAIPNKPMVPYWYRPVQCDGLVVLVAPRTIYVCNPSTMELLVLPPRIKNPRYPTIETVGIGYDSRLKKYKIVRKSGDNLEVFTLGGTNNSWRLAVEQPPCPISCKAPTCLRGAMYWTTVDIQQPAPIGFLRFDLLDESLDLVQTPGSLSLDRYFSFNLIDLDDEQLCFVHFGSNAKVKMWLARDGRALTWTCICTLSISIEQQPFRQNLPIPCAISSDGIILVQIHETLFHCDPQTGMLNQWFDIAAEEELGNVCIPTYFSRFYVFRCPESLVPIKGHI